MRDDIDFRKIGTWGIVPAVRLNYQMLEKAGFGEDEKVKLTFGKEKITITKIK